MPGCSVKNDGRPTALILTRQKLPLLSGSSIEGVAHGGYVIREADGDPDLVILASGSEVALALEAADRLAADGKKARVVSVPCRELFLGQDPAYLSEVLGDTGIPLVAIEAGTGCAWYRIVGCDGLVISMESYGESGPAEDLAVHFGFTRCDREKTRAISNGQQPGKKGLHHVKNPLRRGFLSALFRKIFLSRNPRGITILGMLYFLE